MRYKAVLVSGQRAILWAEAIRDIGILLLVFGPLDLLLTRAHLTLGSWILSSVFVILGLVLIEIGVRIGSVNI
jgi:hypothetical protein